MYPVLLSNRYLRSRLIPLVAVCAVALCVALVIVVVSVMSGFLNMVASSGRTLVGDVVISVPIRGIAHYERLIDRLDARAEVEASSPIVDGFGLLKMPYPPGSRKDTEQVQFMGIDPTTFARVTGYESTLYWQARTPDELEQLDPLDYRRVVQEDLGLDVIEQIENNAMTLERRGRDGEMMVGVVLGLHVSQANVRTSEGTYRPMSKRGPRGDDERPNPLDDWWMPLHDELQLTTLPSDTLSTGPESENATLAVVNEFQSGVYLIDDKRIFIPLSVGQRLLHLDRQPLSDEFGTPTGEFEPARATQVLVRAVDGVTPDELAEVVKDEYERFRQELISDESVSLMTVPPMHDPAFPRVQTWRQQQASFIDPIEKERELMRTIFSLIYLVCAGLVLAIFWAIVYEKTRDIGILRSLGASRFGIAMIFVRYGAIIGVAGAVVGLGLAWLVTRNINVIHDLLGEPPLWLGITFAAGAAIAFVNLIVRFRRGNLLPIALSMLVLITLGLLATLVIVGHYLGGVRVWDPSVYYFDEIPNSLDLGAALQTMGFAVVFSVLGAFFPAARAADTDPVTALRFE